MVDIQPLNIEETLVLRCLLFRVKNFAFYPKIMWTLESGRDV